MPENDGAKDAKADDWSGPTRILDDDSDLDDTPGTFVLVMLRGTSPGRSWPLVDAAVLGRDRACTIAIDDDSVSRRHCKIVRWPSGDWVVQDLESQNGTLVNRQPIGAHALQDGDRIHLGKSVILKFTKQDALERQLVETQKMVAVGRLAAGVAHDYNNVLQIILANASLMHHAALRNQQMSRDEQLEFLEGIQDAARKAAAVTRQLLDFAGKQDGWATQTDLTAAVRGTLKMASTSLGQDLTIEPTLQENVMVEGDPSAISQAILNLLVNARDATSEDGVIRVHLELHTLDDATAFRRHPSLYAGNWAELSISDSGVGMPDDVRERIFEPFYTTKMIGEGTGLGLAIVDGIVRRHGGYIGVDSAPGKGTTFSVYLPARLEAAPLREERPTIHPDGRCVLVVDDDDDVRSATASVIRLAGYKPLQATGGRAAIDLYTERGRDIDLVLLDLAMPGMSGLDTLRVLRELDAEVKVVVCTGYGRHEVRELLQEGAQGFLSKPFNAQQLKTAILNCDLAGHLDF